MSISSVRPLRHCLWYSSFDIRPFYFTDVPHFISCRLVIMYIDRLFPPEDEEERSTTVRNIFNRNVKCTHLCSVERWGSLMRSSV